jgi:porin
MQSTSCRFPVILTLACSPVSVPADDRDDRFSIHGVLAGAGQCRNVSTRLPSASYDVDGSFEAFDNACRGAVPLQLEAGIQLDESSEIFVKFGFAVGNGLNGTSPWVLAPWAAYLEDDVKNINGSSRDYLLVAWYRQNFSLPNAGTLGATLGILDSTDYLDGNEYANDEYTQFMNEAFVNSGGYALPSYDKGAALEWAAGPWSVNVLGMNIHENEAGNNFNFWGIEAGFQADDTPLGDGNYRLVLAGTSSAFPAPAGSKEASLLGWGLSFDQDITSVIGAFLRFSWQQEEAAVDYKALYSGGFNFDGSGWGRDADNIGAGYAYIAGGNVDIAHSQVFETYYRFELNGHAALTADVQYMQDKHVNAYPARGGTAGWIFGLRATAEF